MLSSDLGYLVDPLKEMIYNYSMILDNYRKENNLISIGLVADIIPCEILSAMGFMPVKIPNFLLEEFFSEADGDFFANLNDTYDFFIIPEKYEKKAEKRFSAFFSYFSTFFFYDAFHGYGEDSSVKIHDEVDKFLKFSTGKSIKEIDIEKLQSTAKEYDTMRRFARGILSIRKDKPDLLSNEDIYYMIEASLIFPPALTIDYLENIFNAISKTEYKHKRDENIVNTMIYGAYIKSFKFFDEIEEKGCQVVEDDITNGRRFFDISFDSSSEYIFYEILDSYSYKPFSPGLRKSKERYELLYKLLKNHNIDLMIFLNNSEDSDIKFEIEFLRVKLMRDGIDSLVLSSLADINEIDDYILKSKKHF